MKWDCDIIGDLIPSYVDEVCSEKSRAAVEEHVNECAACKKLLEQQRLMDFSAEKLEERELNGLKKIRSRMKRQTMISYGLGILLLLLGWYAFHGFGYLSKIIYYLLMPVCMLAVYRTREAGDVRKQAGKADGWLMLGAAALIVVSVGFLQITISQALAGEDVLGLEPAHAGPALAMIWAVCFLAEFVILGVLWYRQSRLHIENRFRLCICITGIFLLLVYVESLRTLEDVQGVKEAFMQMSSVILVLGFIGTALSWYLPGKRK